ncbi:signal-regulatory protein beta-2-like [Synchiropus splendidus]|uniref:signal-regulatory protein beta-2-like n=1 Tax=Synchiropus splendidus TaxID=270530 RepID=UPI00237D7705|nr:signal-regulatory protein beta-2-like [Synchiropus splendidus]
MFFVHALLLCSLSAADFSGISQPVSVRSVGLGDSVTIQCYVEGNLDRVWYRLTSAQVLQFVASFTSRFSHVEMSDDIKGRYSVEAVGTKHHLKISPTTWTDVGTYYCGVIQLDRVHFGGGTSLMLKGANMSSHSVVQRPPSLLVKPGDSVTLECSVLHTDLCSQEHTSVMWLKTPKKPPAEIVHRSGRDESHCTNEACEYEFLLKNLSSEDAGTFYCVAAACGQVLLGDGTVLNITSRNIKHPL